jgi:hypothetical protein
MMRNVRSPFKLQFSRSGGALITARVDVWKATQDDWQFVAQYEFSDAAQPTEILQGKLPAGSYTCVFKCFVEESLNGRYKFTFAVGGTDTYADEGDVNLTPADNDSKVFKDQFILAVKSKR